MVGRGEVKRESEIEQLAEEGPKWMLLLGRSLERDEVGE